MYDQSSCMLMGTARWNEPSVTTIPAVQSLLCALKTAQGTSVESKGYTVS